MEYVVSVIVVALISILKALTARHTLLAIPWFEVLTKPSYFGGKEQLFRGARHLFYWVMASSLISLLLTFTILHSSSVAKSTYQFIGYDNPSAGTAGLITTLFFNVVIYLYLVSLTKKEVKRNRSKILKKLQNGDTEIEKEAGVLKLKKIFKRTYYYVPSLLAHIYQFFYLESGHLVQGAAKLTLDGYDIGLINGFFKKHIGELAIYPHSENRKHLLKVQGQLKAQDFNKYDTALALLVIKIELIGYRSTRQYIDHYRKNLGQSSDVKDLGQSSDVKGEEKRQSKRVILKKYIQLCCADGVCDFDVFVTEYSEGCYGLYLTTEQLLEPGDVILVAIDNINHQCALEVVHNNNLTNDSQVLNGFGVRVKNEVVQDYLLDLLAA